MGCYIKKNRLDDNKSASLFFLWYISFVEILMYHYREEKLMGGRICQVRRFII